MFARCGVVYASDVLGGLADDPPTSRRHSVLHQDRETRAESDRVEENLDDGEKIQTDALFCGPGGQSLFV